MFKPRENGALLLYSTPATGTVSSLAAEHLLIPSTQHGSIFSKAHTISPVQTFTGHNLALILSHRTMWHTSFIVSSVGIIFLYNGLPVLFSRFYRVSHVEGCFNFSRSSIFSQIYMTVFFFFIMTWLNVSLYYECCPR